MGLFSRLAVLLLLVTYYSDAVQAAIASERKRGASCNQRYKEINPSHTSCVQPSSQAKNSGVSDSDKTVIVDAHNEERRIVSPPATNMMKMSWDDSLAITAQSWADTCPTGHDKSYDRAEFGVFNVGQNIAWSSPGQGWENAVNLWAGEKVDYDYNTNKPNKPNKMVGHYTQVVWATSIRVGCGFAVCPKNGRDMETFVCNYGPAGNMQGEKPYKTGKSCAACPNSCNNKICDCEDALCKNGGTMDPNTCSCECRASFYDKNNGCSLNCASVKEPHYCPGWRQYCSSVSNAPQDCPKTCGWC